MGNSLISAFKRFIPRKGSFGAHVLTLMTGTTLAQGLAIGAAPILTRLYSPEDFGSLGVFISISSIIAVIGCLRYEMAIMLPRDDGDAANVLALSVLIVLIMSGLIFLVVAWFRQPIAALLKAPALAPWLWLVPVNILMTGLYQAFNFWSSRKKQFRRLAISRVSQAAGGVVPQIGAGLLTQAGTAGLIAGQTIGAVVGTGVLGGQIWRDDRKFLVESVSRKNIWSQARLYRRFPLIDSWGVLANYGAQRLPILILNHFFESTIVGFYFLGFRVLNWPLSFISESLAQVFFQRYEEKRKTSGKVDFLWKMIKLLAIIAVFPAILLFIFAPFGFKIIFGPNWETAGQYTRIMVPILFFRFVASPLSWVLLLENKISLALFWQTIFLIGSVSCFIVGGFLGNIFTTLLLFSAVGSIMYLVLLILVVKSSSAKER